MLATLAPAVRILVVVGALGSLALAAMPVARHLRGQATDLPGRPAPVAPAPADEPTPPDLSSILDLAPFGTVEAEAPTEAPVGETTLDLVLRGVVVQDDPGASTAFIFHGGSTKSYRVGEAIAEGARLVEVASDQVVLEIDGVSQTLSFPDPADAAVDDGFAVADMSAEGGADMEADGGVVANADPDVEPDTAQVTEAPPEVPALSGPERLRQMVAAQTEDDEEAEGSEEPEAPDIAADEGPRTVRDQIDLWRERISANPREALDSIGLIPADNGYRVAEQHDSSVDQAGLQAGDVITSVNGQAVGDVDRDRQLFDEVVASGQARIEVLRDGRALVLTFPLP